MMQTNNTQPPWHKGVLRDDVESIVLQYASACENSPATAQDHAKLRQLLEPICGKDAAPTLRHDGQMLLAQMALTDITAPPTQDQVTFDDMHPAYLENARTVLEKIRHAGGDLVKFPAYAFLDRPTLNGLLAASMADGVVVVMDKYGIAAWVDDPRKRSVRKSA